MTEYLLTPQEQYCIWSENNKKDVRILAREVAKAQLKKAVEMVFERLEGRFFQDLTQPVTPRRYIYEHHLQSLKAEILKEVSNG